MKENTAPMDSKLAYSIPELVRVLRIGRSSIYQEIAAGRLIAQKARGRTIVTHENALAYLANLPRVRSAERQDDNPPAPNNRGRELAAAP